MLYGHISIGGYYCDRPDHGVFERIAQGLWAGKVAERSETSELFIEILGDKKAETNASNGGLVCEVLEAHLKTLSK